MRPGFGAVPASFPPVLTAGKHPRDKADEGEWMQDAQTCWGRTDKDPGKLLRPFCAVKSHSLATAQRLVKRRAKAAQRIGATLALLLLAALSGPTTAQTTSQTAAQTAATGAAQSAERTLPPPARVVSMNLCTDQLAMMLAAPGQLVSVSVVARDPLSSVMYRTAERFPVNHGLAEEIFAQRPDLVLAGTYSSVASVALLRRLGVEVLTLAPATRLDDIPDSIATIARAMGREAEGQQMIAAFRAELAKIRRDPAEGARAALYYANSYSLGDGTLAGQILATAGLRNVAAEAGLQMGGTLPLEVLVMAEPDMVIRGARYGSPSRSEEVLDHPALADLARRGRVAQMQDRDWICGTPHVLQAVAALQDLRPGGAAPEPSAPKPSGHQSEHKTETLP